MLARHALLVLTLSPLAASQVQEVATLESLGSGVNENFGAKIALDGDLALVAAPGQTGWGTESRAHLFDLASGQEIRRLASPHQGADDGFGSSVLLVRGLAFLGACQAEIGGVATGAVYVFDATTGDLVATMAPPVGDDGDRFGDSLAVDGNRLAVGAPGDDDAADDAGAVHVYDFTTLQVVGKLTRTGAQEDEFLGRALAASGGKLLVGRCTNLGPDYSGGAHLFDVTTLAPLHDFAPPGGSYDDGFGYAVALEGDAAVVGAFQDSETNTRAGAAYRFDATSGALLWKYTDPTATWGAELGRSVALEDGILMAGAPVADFHGQVHVIDTSTGTQVALLEPELGYLDEFGASIAIDGRRALLGAPHTFASGKVHHYDLGRTPKVHALVIGVNDDGVGGDGLRGKRSAKRVFDSLQGRPWLGESVLLGLDYADGGAVSWAALQHEVASFVAPGGPVEEGDLFLFYLASHGSQEQETAPGDEAPIDHQVDPFDLDARVTSTQDEVFHLDATFTVRDDELRDLFTGPEWADVDKLFLLDFCFSGGFWGETSAGDSGDLATLPRTAILAASTEANFAWAKGPAENTQRGVGYLADTLERTIPQVGASFQAHEVVNGVLVEQELLTERFGGSLGGEKVLTGLVMANDYSGYYDDLARADVEVFHASTADFEGLVSPYAEDHELGHVYCLGSVDPQGLLFPLRAWGNAEVAHNDLILEAKLLPADALALPLVGLTPRLPLPFADVPCFQGAVGRVLSAAGPVPMNRTYLAPLDLTTLPFGAAQAGDTLYFQVAFRGSTQFGFSQAIGITFR